MQYEIRELGIGGILDMAIRLVKDHFGLLFGIVAVLLIPFQLVQNFVVLAMMPDAQQLTPENMMAFQEAAGAAAIYTVPLSLLFLFIVLPITNGAIIDTIARCYLSEPTSIGSAYSRAMSLIGPLLLTWLLQTLAIMGGMILCIIPGILFAFWFSLSSHVVVIEGLSGTKALSRSKDLMRGNIGTVFVLGILLGVIQWAIVFGAGLIPQQHLSVVASVLLSGIATLYSAAAMVVFYFSCRCKAEDFDLQLLAQSVAGAPSPGDSDEPQFD